MADFFVSILRALFQAIADGLVDIDEIRDRLRRDPRISDQATKALDALLADIQSESAAGDGGA